MISVKKAYKFRMYPNKKQQELINKTFGCCRFVYNKYLAKRIDFYKNDKETFTYKQCSSDLTNLKKELKWLKEPDKFSLQNALKDLENAYNKFFKEKTGFPKFKSKKTNRFSYKTNFTNGNIMYCGQHIKLPKLGMVKIRDKQVPQGRILNATIS
ncbi:TPA: helix-turn-helix domain-containing protein, partial [Clostridioides difficile]|nr:helix-turn-helix domain-containing protein [Clostridioides difficile]HBG8141224.1 helix-turn-helix domain-containing protein [Clostridioides difficile]HBG8275075.1 helix-turn-helix domain-containing protein [Clostridioides difficile]HDP8979652.1 helix-turn-helix domain-containing protein [Clostridioides difficile]HDQ2301923.1 helix-turn-helix domain-containing protein [Clostridioides difficile]